ncbi:MAG TPA: glucuronyl hydrolase, partial [Segetibacter sp.]
NTTIQKVISLAEQQYQAYIKTYSDTIRYPRSSKANGTLYEVNSDDWTSGFFPGCLWYLYQFTKKDQWKNTARKWTEGLEKEKNNTGTHDLGSC